MPKPIEVSVDEYVSKRSLVTKDGIVYRAAKMPKSFNAETRSATFVMTDETVDSYGDIVRAKGCDLTRFETNPICLLNHKADLPIGTWSDVKRIVRRIEGTTTLAAEGTAPHVDMTYNLMSQGILRACSIGFMPTKVERRLDENGEPLWSYDILEWQMYECSVVSVPANPNALAKSMKDGCMLARDFLEEVLDNYIKTPTGLILNIADVESAYKEGTGEKTTIVIEKTEDESTDVEIEVKTAVIDPGDGTVTEADTRNADLLTDEVRDAFAAQVEKDDVVVLRDADELKLVIERSGEEVGELILPLDMTIREINELSEDICARVNARTAAPEKEKTGNISVDVDIDTTGATEKMTALEALVDRVGAKFAKFFGKSEPEKIEPPAPPPAEKMEAAKAKATAVRERLASKGLIEA